jgi:hypothetical protein
MTFVWQKYLIHKFSPPIVVVIIIIIIIIIIGSTALHGRWPSVELLAILLYLRPH